MKTLILVGALIFSQLVLASEPPANYPLVKGIVRKIDLNSARISIKHDDIPNLHMPGMTMSFLVQDPEQLKVLAVGDSVKFAADEFDGELTVLWIQKSPSPSVATSNIFCTGMAPTKPKTNVEIEIRPDSFSTIQYEYAEGPYQGDSHINSIGDLHLHKQGDTYIYHTGPGVIASTLVFKVNDKNEITDACFSNYSANMNREPVECSFEESLRLYVGINRSLITERILHGHSNDGH